MVTIHNRAGEAIRHSRNLRGILDHARREVVAEVHIGRLLTGEGGLQIVWANGDTCTTHFASYPVLVGWVLTRRNFRGAALWVNGQRSGEVSPRHTLMEQAR